VTGLRMMVRPSSEIYATCTFQILLPEGQTAYGHENFKVCPSGMVSSGMLRRVAVVRIDVSEESIASIIRVTRIGEPGTTLAVTSNRRTLRIPLGISSQCASVSSYSYRCS
jgi:hypothetical protein